MRTCARTSKLKVREFGNRPDGAANCEVSWETKYRMLNVCSFSRGLAQPADQDDDEFFGHLLAQVRTAIVDVMTNVVAVRGLKNVSIE